MADDIIPNDVRLFIVENIDSIAQLEGLLLLRSSPGQPMSAADLAKRLYIGEKDAEEFLQALTSVGFLKFEDEKFRYVPASADLDVMAGRVADIYTRYLVPLTNLIHSKPRSKVQKFADAFKIRKD